MATSNEHKPIRIAIIGGGLAGATMARGLLKHPRLSIKIFESAPEFSERGAAVGISINGLRALKQIGVEDALPAAGSVTTNSARMFMGVGPEAGEVVMDLGAEKPGERVHRAAFLSQLLKPVSRDVMFTNKKLMTIASLPDGEITLSFRDGTQEHVDAVIGADGVHGQVRKYILGVDNPALNPSFAGFWATTNLVSMARAKEVLGDEFLRDDRQYTWIGDGVIFFHVVLNNGETVQCFCGAMTDEEWSPDEWKRDLDRKTLEDTFGTLNESPHAKGMIELLLDAPQPQLFSIWHHATNASTYTKGPVCMMGDAAHCMTPWQASGASQAIEDAMILETLLGSIRSPEQIPAALKAYDEVRRPRTQQIVASSVVTGRLFMGREQGVGMDVGKMRELMARRWDFVYGLDVEAHKREALAAMSRFEQQDCL